jgi:hypothetical protein
VTSRPLGKSRSIPPAGSLTLFLFLLASTRGFFRLRLGSLMRGGVVRSFVMRRFRVRCGLMVDRLGMSSGLVMLAFGVSCGLMVFGFGMCPGWVRLAFRVGTRLVMGSGLMMDRSRLGARVLDRLGMRCIPRVCARRMGPGIGLDYVAGLAMIDREMLIAVISSFLLMGSLRLRCLEMMIASSRFLGGSGSGLDSTRTIEADAIICCSIINNRTIHIGIVDDVRIHAPSRGIIPEGVALPSTSGEAGTIITKAIVDPPVISNVPAPITVVPMIKAVAETPITRGPKISPLRNFHPSARNPEITIVSIGPVAWIPKISVVRTRRLVVGDEGWRGNGNRNRLSKKRSRWAEQGGEENGSDGFH